jgi:hypothetical protein
MSGVDEFYLSLELVGQPGAFSVFYSGQFCRVTVFTC